MTAPDDQGLVERFGRLEARLDELGRLADPGARGIAVEVVRTLLDYHAAALQRILGRIALQGEAGRAILDQCAEDELIGGLLLLHGLHPSDPSPRIRRSLDAIGPTLQAQGADVALLDVEGGVVRLRLQEQAGGCRSRPSPSKGLIEGVILETAPDVKTIEFVEGPSRPAPGWVPLSTLTAQAALVSRDRS